MKTVTVLVPLNFDVENGNLEEVQNVIDSINALLSRNTYDCNDAQILSSSIDEADITINADLEEEKTNVEFYVATYEANELDEQPYKEVIAVFDVNKAVQTKDTMFDCYAHLGQHSNCSLSFLRENCKKATEQEYKDLFNELTNSVGYNLNVL